MIDLATEREHLAKAERDVAEGTGRVSRQADLVEQLRGSGHDVATATELLETLRQTLQAWEAHRDIILSTIAKLEASGSDPVTGAPPEPEASI